MCVTDGQRRTDRPALRLLALLIVILCPNALPAAPYDNVEVKPFGLLGTDASLSIRYSLDENDRSADSSVTNFEHRATWEQELFLVSRSYVYHPGFLNMELGGGPLLVQQSFESNTGSNSNNESLFNVLARFNFLDFKTYPFSLYYRRDHPSVTTSLSGRFLTRSEEFGFTGRKNFIDSMAGLTVELSQRDVSGSGFESVIDEILDQGRFTFTKSYRKNDSISFEYNRFTRDSSSGSLGLPIQESRIQQQRWNINARNKFGGDNQFYLSQALVGLKQDNETTVSTQQDDLIYTASGRWQNSEAIRSTFDYRFYESDRVDADVKAHNSAAGFIHNVNDSFRYDLRLDHEDVKQTGFDKKNSGIRAGANFSQSARIGSYSLGGSLRQARTDQESDSDTIQVFDERVTLNGTTPVDLLNEFVITSTVFVTNAAGTQTFIEDVDYRLVVIGSVTSIQRLIDGNIFDGQTVLIDYQYQTSGTAKFDTFSSSIVASLNFLKYANASLRYSLNDTRIISGQLTTPINDRDVIEATLGIDVPLGRRWQVGASVRHVNQDEDIAPAVSNSVAFDAAAQIVGSLSMRLGASLIEVDQKNSIEDVDQVNFRFGINGRVFGWASVAYDATYCNIDSRFRGDTDCFDIVCVQFFQMRPWELRNENTLR
jgi:hypothetical protein